MKKVLMHVTVVVCMIALLCCSAYARVAASTDRIYSGIDVSVWQGEINFEAVRQDGIEIVYIRSSSGTDSSIQTLNKTMKGPRPPVCPLVSIIM